MGLRPEIYSEVKMQEPKIMDFALCKALKQEQRLKDVTSTKSISQNFKRNFQDNKGYQDNKVYEDDRYKGNGKK